MILKLFQLAFAVSALASCDSRTAMQVKQDTGLTRDYKYKPLERDSVYPTISIRFTDKDRPFFLIQNGPDFTDYGIINWNDALSSKDYCGIYSDRHWSCFKMGVLESGEDVIDITVHGDSLRLFREGKERFFRLVK